MLQSTAGPGAPPLSVIICTRNRPDKLGRAVRSILRNTLRDFELLVVDQSTDRRSAMAMQAIDDPRLRHIGLESTGIAISRNIGIRTARAEIVVFTDDDCIADANWLQAILAEFRRDPEAAAVFGRVVPYGAAPGKVCPVVFESTEPRRVVGAAVPQRVVGHGNNMSIRKAALRRVGLFHERLGCGSPLQGAEDTEFVFRLLRSGQPAVYSPRPLIEHDHWYQPGALAAHTRESLTAVVAVYAAYALRFDRTAALELLRMAYYAAGDRFGLASRRAGLLGMVSGLAKARIVLRETPPTLEASSEPLMVNAA